MEITAEEDRKKKGRALKRSYKILGRKVQFCRLQNMDYRIKVTQEPMKAVVNIKNSISLKKQ